MLAMEPDSEPLARRQEWATQVTEKVKVKANGVLGVVSTRDAVGRRREEQVAPRPDAAIPRAIVAVDPAGLHLVHGAGPAQAGTASGAIYEWLGIRHHAAFPQRVRVGLQREAGQQQTHSECT
jgi:hypothetical protein